MEHPKIYCLYPLIVLLFSCTQPILLTNIVMDQPGFTQYGKQKERLFSENKSISELLQLKWTFSTNGSQSNSSVIIYDKYLFVGDLSGRFYVIDRENGNQIGAEKFSGAIHAAPIILNSRAFLTVNDKDEKYSSLVYFDLIEGRTLNSDVINGAVNSEIIKLDDGIIVLTSLGEIIKYNLIGRRIWSTKTGISTKSNPASDGNSIIFGNENGEIICADAITGKVRYRYKQTSSIESGFTIDGETTYYGDNNGFLNALNLQDGKTVWQFYTGSKIVVSPVFNTSQIFIGNLAGDLFCIDKNNGRSIWKCKMNGLINTTPFLFKNYLIQPNAFKEVDLVNTATGKIENKISFETRVKLSPVFYENTLYIGIDKGIINAYQVFENK